MSLTRRSALATFFLALALVWPAAALTSDEFIAGYATGILQHEFNVTDAVVEVRNGRVIVTGQAYGNVDRRKVEAALQQIPGVTRAEVREADPAKAPAVAEAVQTTIPLQESNWLPHGLLFSPLHADPRWPHFSIAYRSFTEGLNLSKTFAANFGETFSIYRNRSFFGGDWEFGVQAGVFSLFDIDSASIDLVNADYRVGFLSSYRRGPLSGFIRVQHQSSHLGDEFILNNPQVTRVNLSYEEVDMKLSYNVFAWLRLYGGAGYIVHRQPADLGRGTAQWGVELTSPRTYWGGRLRPVAYADFQCHERMNWTINRSILAGVQFENARIGDRQIQLLAEYYDGRSPDGQFYTHAVSWYGVGLHLYF